ncbi:MAG: HisA/HisF-related TIM barrel protein [Acidobacteria bacterium]|nr:HisA/HisF-related TIM barrel protein [Acidobacteriota bacterium]
MLIPSIDLRGGQVVQLVQGKRLALAFDDVFAWVDRFAGYRRVQLIDLDRALATGTNETLARQICARVACRVGGGVRDIARAQRWLDGGAREVIVGSAFFGPAGIDTDFAGALASAVGAERVIAAIDSIGGRVVVRGWQKQTTVSPEEAARQLEPYCGGFLYTHVETEGMMEGIDMAAVARVHAATSRPISAAGGITTAEEIAALEALGIDAVVGMAIYTGRLPLRARSEP